MISYKEMEDFVSNVRKDFPIYDNNPNLIYLDSAATSLKPKCVIDKMNEYYEKYGVNIHRGVYKLSYIASSECDQARAKVAKFINANPMEIVFTKNASDSLNSLCLMYSKLLKAGDEILTSYQEHHSSVLPWLISSKENNFKLTYMPLDKDGRLSVSTIQNSISDKTKVIVINYISNVLGYVNDIKRICELAHKQGIIVIVDGAQAVQHLPIDVKELDCDFFAFSSHKMFGPTGIGVLYGKKKLLKQLKPLYYGGDMNENVDVDHVDIKEVPYCFETGTPMIAEIIGLGKAIDYINSIGLDKIKKHDESIMEYLELKLKDISGIEIYNKGFESTIFSFNIHGVHPHDAASFFDQYGVCLRAGHHCAQLMTKWLGCNGTLRASFFIYNDYKDVDVFIDSLKRIIKFFKENL